MPTTEATAPTTTVTHATTPEAVTALAPAEAPTKPDAPSALNAAPAPAPKPKEPDVAAIAKILVNLGGLAQGATLTSKASAADILAKAPAYAAHAARLAADLKEALS